MFRLTPDRRLPRRLFEPDQLAALIPLLLLNLCTLGPTVLAIYFLGSMCAGNALPPDLTGR